MKVGVIKEIKDKEHRVALTPAGTRALHRPVIRCWCKLGQDLAQADAQYGDAGAHIVTVEAWMSTWY
jgi:alanine dehydrogenase